MTDNLKASHRNKWDNSEYAHDGRDWRVNQQGVWRYIPTRAIDHAIRLGFIVPISGGDA